MGCDIHLTVELQQEDGGWSSVPEPGATPQYDWDPCVHWDFYRQYACFAVLAGVRNYDHMKPISEPRGLPVNRALKNESEYGDHSYSWLMFSEVLGYDWDQRVRQSGRIPKEQADWIKAGLLSEPSGYDPRTQPELVDAEWVVTYREACSNLMIFIRDVRAALPGVDPERIRLVFGFDS